jgi:hypothetical protein
MIEWNPVPHMRHAWSATKTSYGKVGLVLFYALIWSNIASSIWTMIDPTSQGMDCILDSFKGEQAKDLFVAFTRYGMITTIGFFLYADVGGFKTKNVALVTVVVVSGCWIGLRESRSLACAQANWYFVSLIVWSVLSLLLVHLDTILGGPGGSEDERTPLTA